MVISLSSISLWAAVLEILDTLSSNGSLGSPPRLLMTEFQHMMHCSWPMSTPYLYHLAASTSLWQIPLMPYS